MTDTTEQDVHNPRKKLSLAKKEIMKRSFTQKDWLEVPPSVKNRFLGEGYVLKWVRISIRGEHDYKNLGMKQAEGWEFVRPSEVPELVQGFQIQEDERFGGSVLIRGDVALAKLPVEWMEAKKEAVRERTEALTQALEEQLARHSNAKMPISDSSTRRVKTGRLASFDS